MGDNLRTLSPDCREEVEAEANFAAARLLFLRDRFTEQARSAHPSINLIRSLRDTFGNTLSATLYHFVETAGSSDHLRRRRAARLGPCLSTGNASVPS